MITYSDNVVINKDKLKKFNSNSNLVISVYESNSESNSKSNKDGFSFKNIKESYDLWFNILKNLYLLRNKCKLI